ncbi:MFS transporter [Rhodococcus sp. 06-462-5]|uniref:MFS transporter n=1 Tax=Nocardiaceae TaxID=85025 RepID=UPI00068EF331|nr:MULTISPECIES: MFS transporter [Rhodococcus]OZC73967.1 MFS transporter [Rhodococcus sp. 06-462-5]OZE67963.1 MFS transporter [Rhodococcus sp. 02-925g]OZF52016.1 MFS transporter [Rhodococcus sp. 14-1411-2a]
MTDRTAHPSGGLTRGRTFTVLATCVGAMVTFLQITASVSSLGAVQAALQVSPAALVWVPSAYTLAVAALVLSSGTLGSLFGRRRMFRVGTLVLASGAALVVFANSLPILVVGQLVAGAGGALILPNGLALVAAAFPDPHRRTEMITLWAASSGIGLAVGPISAGVLLDHVEWGYAFVPAIMLSAIAFGLTFGGVPESLQPGARLDPGGLVLGTTAIAAVVYGLIEGGGSGYLDGRVVAAWVIAAVAVVVFVIVELRVDSPMLDVRLFTSPSFATISVIAAIALFGFTGLAVLQVFFYERAQSLDALATGWRLVVVFVAYVVVAAVAGRIVRRTGFVLPLASGLLLGAIAAVGLLTQNSSTGFGMVWFWFALFGAGVGLVAAPSTAAAMVSVDPARTGMASGAVNAARQLGSVLGTSTLGAVLTTTVIHRLPSELEARGVPEDTRVSVATAMREGRPISGSFDGDVVDALGSAYTAGVHTGLTVIAALFAAGAVATVLFVRNRPHTGVDRPTAPTGAAADVSTVPTARQE